ncbi:MAG: Thymidylate kinase [Ignavibacteria bacterium]|nr:Thymidylate kinase [Ignavibacteria bacterium]
MFITFEGIDLSGKSTQIKLLENYYKKRKKKVITVREPGGTMISEKIRDIILDREHLNMSFLTEFMLFSSSRSQLVNEVILPYLKRSYIVLCDRFFDSSTAYQGYGGGIDLKIINSINKTAAQGLMPDKTFLIHISIEESLRRKKLMGKSSDRIEQKKISYYRKVIKGYLEISEKNKKRFTVIDGNKSVIEIHKEIIQSLSRLK